MNGVMDGEDVSVGARGGIDGCDDDDDDDEDIRSCSRKGTVNARFPPAENPDIQTRDMSRCRSEA